MCVCVCVSGWIKVKRRREKKNQNEVRRKKYSMNEWDSRDEECISNRFDVVMTTNYAFTIPYCSRLSRDTTRTRARCSARSRSDSLRNLSSVWMNRNANNKTEWLWLFLTVISGMKTIEDKTWFQLAANLLTIIHHSPTKEERISVVDVFLKKTWSFQNGRLEMQNY